jgi:hypothetical protein
MDQVNRSRSSPKESVNHTIYDYISRDSRREAELETGMMEWMQPMN